MLGGSGINMSRTAKMSSRIIHISGRPDAGKSLRPAVQRQNRIKSRLDTCRMPFEITPAPDPLAPPATSARSRNEAGGKLLKRRRTSCRLIVV
jgi:hypothetical protein